MNTLPIHLQLAAITDSLIQINSTPEFEAAAQKHPELLTKTKQAIDTLDGLWWTVRSITVGYEPTAVAPSQNQKKES